MYTETTLQVNTAELEQKVKNMYRDVALRPQQRYHFEMGRALAEKLGYDSNQLDEVPPEAIESFAGVGFFFNYANFKEGDKVLDLGSGSGMDAFLAALQVGKTGSVTGVDMTEEQVKKAERLRNQYRFSNVNFSIGHIENLPFEDNSFDAVISNGVINLCPDKRKVFQEIARVLKPNGRMAIADIVSEKSLSTTIVCNATLWAACIGGAAQKDEYRDAIERARLQIRIVSSNDQYAFISAPALGTSRNYGVYSISLLATKTITGAADDYDC